ncbi:hypothetical protein FOL47_004706, partial [Perkinsus chesapeaki]
VLRLAKLEAPIEKRSETPMKEISFLSLLLSSQGWRLTPDALQELEGVLASVPIDLGGLRSRIGFVKYCKGAFGSLSARTSLSSLLDPFNRLVASFPKSARKNTRLDMFEDLLSTLRTKVWWPGMATMVIRCIQECPVCYEVRRSRLVEPGVNPRTPVVSRFEVCYTDFGHPPRGCGIPTDDKYKAFVVFVCAGSGFVIASPVESESAEVLVRELAIRWIAYFGVPSHLISDRGPAYRSR